jgi:UDP-4-amino-4,6-dideoxy-N-acetyl-beta-L-altrosamine transaminase
MIPYGKQEVLEKDIDAVIEVLKSDFLTQGNIIPSFERALARKVGAVYAVAVNSATSALHIACCALGLGEGDSLWTTPITFAASANCGRYCGASIDFVDIDPTTFNMDAEVLNRKLAEAEKQGNLPKIIVVVHLCGLSSDMAKIFEIANKYGVSVIEDASHAVGAKYQDSYVGCGQYSDVTIFSFHPVKIITTGEGGMAVTNNGNLAKKMELLRSHGITRDSQMLQKQSDGPWYYEQIDLGFNYRLTDIQAALGLSQLSRLDEYIQTRNTLANRYKNELGDLPLAVQTIPEGCYSSYHLFVIRLQLEECAATHRDVFEGLREDGIGVNLHYIPLYRHPYFERMGYSKDAFPEAESYYREAISLPLFPTLSSNDQNCVIEAVRKRVL